MLSLEKAVLGLRSGSQLGLGPEPAPDLDSELSGPGLALVLASDLLELGLAVGSELASVSGQGLGWGRGLGLELVLGLGSELGSEMALELESGQGQALVWALERELGWGLVPALDWE